MTISIATRTVQRIAAFGAAAGMLGAANWYTVQEAPVVAGVTAVASIGLLASLPYIEELNGSLEEPAHV